MKTKHVLIIGGGIGGLATAALLGKQGYKVTVLEKNEAIGGRASVWKSKGFTFDLGPSWYLMPDVFEKYFALFGRKPNELFQLHHLDPHYRVYFGKKDFVDIKKSISKNLDLFDSLEPGVSERIKTYLTTAETQYNAAIKYILYNNYSSIKDFLSHDLAREGRKLNIFENLDHYVSRFTTSERVKQILEYTIVFLGGSPKNTPAFYSIMSHIDFKLGVFYPMGGVYQIVKALEKLCRENGVIIKTNQEVTEIVVDGKVAKQVKTINATYDADIVISNADYPFTETMLLPKEARTYPESYWQKKTIAPSAFLIYLGVKGKIKNLKHHNLFFANNWEEHFEQIFKDPQWPEKPSYYVCSPSKTDPSVAPKDDENLFVLVPVPAGIEDTDAIRKSYADKILSHLEGLLDENFVDRIVVKKVFSQRDFIERYNAYKGTALGLAHTLTQTALFRPRMRSKKVQNLFYVGQYTQPGIGMPMCMISAEIIAKEIKKAYE
jgi:1-hydroxy-2-isopentenylcarotenoid 3,4-desaturase